MDTFGRALLIVLLLSGGVLPTEWAKAQAAPQEVWALLVDLGAPADAPARPSSRSDGEAFAALLEDRFATDSDRIVLRLEERLSAAELRETIRRFAELVHSAPTPEEPETSRLVLLYLRAEVTRPPQESAIYFFSGAARLADGTGNNPEAIRDTTLSEWVQALEPATVLTLLDLRTQDESLGVYFAARTEIGDGRLVTIAREELPTPVLDLLSGILSEAPDPDRDGFLRWEEVLLEYQRRVYATGVSSDRVLVGGTGNPDLVLMALPARLYVESVPLEAEVLLDGQSVGKTPYVLGRLRVGSAHTIQVRKAGYRLPDPQTVLVEQARGAAYVARFVLQPVTIRVQVSAPGQEMLGPIVVVIPGTPFQTTLPTLGEAVFSVGEEPLTVGETYRLIAATPDDRYFGTASFLYTGYQDVTVAVSLQERTAWEVAAARFEAGFTEEALAAAEQALREGLLEPPELPGELVALLLERWGEREAARPLIVCAQLLERIGAERQAQRYWRRARELAPPDSPERALADAHVRSGWGRWGLILLLVLILGGTGLFAYRTLRGSRLGG
ncbi:MAG: hypothetical protein KatS3mg115_0073 [Candidatus Poribacteria bacterium]|nr:MAG: hypothetical protein KatS3mg115_0073 [Candidatus Poribacteria bacterium]